MNGTNHTVRIRPSRVRTYRPAPQWQHNHAELNEPVTKDWPYDEIPDVRFPDWGNRTWAHLAYLIVLSAITAAVLWLIGGVRCA